MTQPFSESIRDLLLELANRLPEDERRGHVEKVAGLFKRAATLEALEASLADAQADVPDVDEIRGYEATIQQQENAKRSMERHFAEDEASRHGQFSPLGGLEAVLGNNVEIVLRRRRD